MDGQNQSPLLARYACLSRQRDDMYQLWSLMEADGAAQAFFYAQEYPSEYARGDLTAFVQYCMTPGRDLLLAYLPGQDPFGMLWLDEVPGRPNIRFINFWYRRHTTRLARQATQQVMAYVFATLGCDLLAGFTPYRTAAQHVLSLGWSRMGTLPRMAMIQGVPTDLRFYGLDKSTWASRRAEGATHATTL